MPLVRLVSIRSVLFRPFWVSSSLLAGACAHSGTSELRRDDVELAASLERELAVRAEAAAAARRSGDPWDLWAACLETSAPAVIAARHELARAEASARAAGAVAAMLDVEHVSDGSMRETQVMLAFDLPGLVGAGRAGAERARAEVDAAKARAEYRAVRFETQHELERSLAALAVARRLEADLLELERSVADPARRLDLLDARGWLPREEVLAARLMLHHLAAMRSEQAGAVASARARVAAASGLAHDSPWLDEEEATGLLAIRQRTWGRAAQSDLAAAELLDRQPELLLARYDYLGAEADVRIACAERWPALLIGPNAMWTADELLLGGVLRLDLPWPPAAAAAVDAARAAREAARDALVSQLARAQNDVVERRAVMRAAERSLREHAELLLEASATALRARQARFAVDVEMLREWSMAVEQRSRALVTHAEALERWLVATFDLSQSLGTDTANDAESADAAGDAR